MSTRECARIHRWRRIQGYFYYGCGRGLTRRLYGPTRGGGGGVDDQLAVPLRTHLIVGKFPLDFLSSSLRTDSILVRIAAASMWNRD